MDDPELECEARGFRGVILLGVLPKEARERRGVVGVMDAISDIVAAGNEARMRMMSSKKMRSIDDESCCRISRRSCSGFDHRSGREVH